MKKLFLLSFLIIFRISAAASPLSKVSQITTNEGLSNNTIRAIMQDSQGYIWFCTPDGLNRYDGSSITTFRPSADTNKYMTDNKIRNIQEDNTGHLWIGMMSEHFDCYDIARHRFVPATYNNGKLIEHSKIAFVNDTTWLWGNTTGCGFVVFNNKNSKCIINDKQFSALASVFVNFVAKGQDAVWIGTENGLFRWDGNSVSCIQKQGNFIAYHFGKYGDAFLTDDGNVCTLNKQKKSLNTIKGVNHGRIFGTAKFGSLWLIYSANGCSAFNLNKSAFVEVPNELNVEKTRRLIYDNKGNCWLSDNLCQLTYINDQRGLVRKFNLMPREMLVQNYEFYSAFQGKNDQIWISTNGNGLFCYDMRSDMLHHFSSSQDSPIPLPSGILKSVYEDRSGSVWLGTALVGVVHIQFVNSSGVETIGLSHSNNGQSNQVRLLQTLTGGQLMVGNRNGEIFKVDDSNCSSLQLFKTMTAVPYCAYEDKDQTMWIGTKGNGIFAGEKNYMHVSDDETSLSDDNVYDILPDAKSRLWIATFGGGLNLVVRGNGKTLRFKHFFNSSRDKYIRKLSIDNNGWMWMATSNGVIAFNPEHLIADHSNYIRLSSANGKLRTDEIKAIYCDNNGHIWISEAGYGISMCQPNGNYEDIEVTHFSAQHGITNPMVQSFEEDDRGHIWASTEYGIISLNPEHGSTHTHYLSPDIMTNNFCENSSCRLDDGRLVFGTNNGAIIITPSQMKYTATGTDVHLIEAKVNGGQIDSQNVEADYNFITLDLYFSTFDYSSIVPPMFMYMLENHDDEWSEPTRSNCFSIRELSPGDYILHVKALMPQGNWSEQLLVPITIHQSAWTSWWAIIIYILLACGIIYIIFRRYRHVISLRRHISEQDKKMNIMQNMFAESVKKDANMDESDAELLENIEQVATASICEADFTSEDFAKRLNMGHTTFYNTMNRLTGKSPKEYLRHIRMKEAARLLLTSNKNVSEIAYQVGFNEISYFSKCFKQHFGMSPQAYKNSQLNGNKLPEGRVNG